MTGDFWPKIKKEYNCRDSVTVVKRDVKNSVGEEFHSPSVPRNKNHIIIFASERAPRSLLIFWSATCLAPAFRVSDSRINIRRRRRRFTKSPVFYFPAYHVGRDEYLCARATLFPRDQTGCNCWTIAFNDEYAPAISDQFRRHYITSIIISRG